MAGIYLHIPFCRKACVYCNFHFSTNLLKINPVFKALCQEIKHRRNYLEDAGCIQSIYFGGGTPSVLRIAALEKLLEHVHRFFEIDPQAEITLEANPDDLTPAYLQGLHQLGINRLSIGIQSFDDERLKWMNRSHTATQAIQCVHQAKEAGISNISIDLIFGLPKSDMAYWQQQLNCAHELGVPHLSVYALTVERRTALAHQIKKGLLKPAKDALYADQFMFTHHELTGRGYEHYEISSYALPGARSRHNSSYWQQLPYLGVGPSAHSFDKYSRCWNVSSNLGYIKAINERGEAVEATEHLSPLDRYHEYLLTGLRRCEGIDSQHIQQAFGIEFPGRYASKVARWIKRGYMQQLGARYTLTAEGWLLSDRLISELFLDEEP